MIILTRSEAEYVLGVSPTHGYAALEPVPLPSGEYILPEDVLADPANTDVKNFLNTLPKREITPEESWDFGTLEDPDETARAAYDAARLVWHEPTDVRLSPARASRVGL
jgi:hypothetical protein